MQIPSTLSPLALHWNLATRAPASAPNAISTVISPLQSTLSVGSSFTACRVCLSVSQSVCRGSRRCVFRPRPHPRTTVEHLHILSIVRTVFCKVLHLFIVYGQNRILYIFIFFFPLSGNRMIPSSQTQGLKWPPTKPHLLETAK